jgi:hypothetical protein
VERLEYADDQDGQEEHQHASCKRRDDRDSALHRRSPGLLGAVKLRRIQLWFTGLLLRSRTGDTGKIRN